MGVDAGRRAQDRRLTARRHVSRGGGKCSLTDCARRIEALIHCPVTSEEAHMDKADLVIKSNVVFTGDGLAPFKGGVAIAGDRIVACGED